MFFIERTYVGIVFFYIIHELPILSEFSFRNPQLLVKFAYFFCSDNYVIHFAIICGSYAFGHYITL